MRILLHTCCGPCACFPVANLKQKGHEITAFFFNPNIHPYREFQRRLEAAEQLCTGEGLEMIVDNDYDIQAFLRGALESPERPARCSSCYSQRLNEAARIARERGFDSFSTTLLVSPYQYHELVREAGKSAGKRHGVEFFYQDFRPGWNEGVAIAKQKGLYRQPYCGCIFSEVERYRKRGMSE